jgi:hypothetical protein
VKVKEKRFVTAMALCSLSVLALPSLAQRPPLPQGTILCHVLTESGVPGLVVVQTENREDALIAARTSLAWVGDGLTSRATAVVECAVQPEERLSDPAVQALHEILPM